MEIISISDTNYPKKKRILIKRQLLY